MKTVRSRSFFSLHTRLECFEKSVKKCFIPSIRLSGEIRRNVSYPLHRMKRTLMIRTPYKKCISLKSYFMPPPQKIAKCFLTQRIKNPEMFHASVLLFIINFLSSLINCRKICQLHRRGSCAFIRREFPDLRLE